MKNNMEKNKIQEAEEQLKRVLLMMKYDSSKTLTENEDKIILEQPTPEAAPQKDLTDADLLGDTSVSGNLSPFTRLKGVKGLVDLIDGYVSLDDLQDIQKIIQGFKGKCWSDASIGKRYSAMQRVIELYKYDEGENLYDDVKGIGTETLRSPAAATKQNILEMIKQFQSEKCAPVAQKCPPEKPYLDPKTGQCTDKPVPPVPPVPPTTPCPVGDADAVKKFQDWLDQNHSGWHEKYTTLNKSVERGYGKCGPRTRKNWELYKNEYLGGGSATTTTTQKPIEGPTPEENDIETLN